MQNAHIAKINLAARMIGVGVLAAAIPVAGLSAASCAAPVRELEVEGQVRQISSAQTTLGVVTKKKIYVWNWSDLDKPPQTGIPPGLWAPTLLAGPRVLAIVKPQNPSHECDFLLTDLDGQEVYGRWPSGEEWWFAEVGSSRTGEFAGIVSQESVKRKVSEAKPIDADRDRRLGILRASGGEIIWMPVIPPSRVYSTRATPSSSRTTAPSSRPSASRAAPGSPWPASPSEKSSGTRP